MRRGILHGIFVLAVSLCAGSAIAGEALRFVGDVRPPLAMSADNGTVVGMAADLTREVFSRIGVPPELHLFPWRRALSLAERGEVDGLMLVLRTPDRERYLAFSDPVVSLVASFYYNPSNFEQPKVRDLEDLQGRVIGLVSGHSYGDAMDRYFQGDMCRVMPAYTLEENVRRLVDGRVDLIISQESGVEDVLARYPAFRSNVRRCCSLGSYVYRMAFSRSSPHVALLPRVNEALAAMRQDGSIDRIFHLSAK